MNTAESSRLTFGWEQVRRTPMLLAGFVILSAAGHLCAFFVFQVVYPPQASIKAPHPSLTIIDPRRPDHQTLLRWIDAEDPAPAASGASSVTDRLLEVSYRPSFATMRTAPLSIPEPPQTVLFPPARDPLAIIRSVESKPPPLLPPATAKPTRLVFTGKLADRVPDSLPPFTVAARVSKAVDSPEFMIGVSDRGEIRFIFPQRPSAEPSFPEAVALDAEATEWVSRIKLKPGKSEMTWGGVRIDWGPEIYVDPLAARTPAPAKSHP